MAGHADVIFAGGAVYTAGAGSNRVIRAIGPDGSPASAAAVADGRIVAVGSAADARLAELKGPRTELVDLRGRALLPGFQDAHAHPAFAGVTMMSCNLIGAATLDEATRRIAEYVASHPGKEWISGSGWRMEWFERGTPSRHQLDGLTGGRPAFLLNRDGHGAGQIPGHLRSQASTRAPLTRLTAGLSATRTDRCRGPRTKARRT